MKYWLPHIFRNVFINDYNSLNNFNFKFYISIIYSGCTRFLEGDVVREDDQIVNFIYNSLPLHSCIASF